MIRASYLNRRPPPFFVVNNDDLGDRGHEGKEEQKLIEKIIEICAKNRFLVFTVVLLLTLGGVYAIKNIPLDAIPDISDVQVIVYTPWEGRSPDLVEDQVTYPVVSALISAPKVKTVRGFSDFGFSYVYAIFEDGTDIYWARSRVL